jgi:hypothetical protein
MKEIIVTKYKRKNSRTNEYDISAFDTSKKDTLIDQCITHNHDDVQGIVHYMTGKHNIRVVTHEVY